MKRLVVMLGLLITSLTVLAQEPQTAVMRQFVVEPSATIAERFTSPHIQWSPDSRLIAVGYAWGEPRNPAEHTLWKLYDVETGTQLNEFAQWIAWYADSRRLLIRPTDESAPTIIDARTGALVAVLQDTGSEFPDSPIDRLIMNRDERDTLRICDAETGVVRLVVEHTAGLPIISPDGSQFAVNIIESGVQIYDTADLSLTHEMAGYRTDNAIYPFRPQWSPNSAQLVVVPLDSVHRFLGPRFIWTLESGLSAPLYNVTAPITWSPNGTQIAAPSDYTKIRRYDSVTGVLISTIRLTQAPPIKRLTWDDPYLIVDSGDYITTPLAVSIWDFERQTLVLEQPLDVTSIGERAARSFSGMRFRVFSASRWRRVPFSAAQRHLQAYST